MEHGDAENHDWPMQRRVEGIVSQHMADIALEALQQRLTAVSEEVHSLAQHVSRRSGEEFKDEPRRGDLNFGVEPPLSSACNPDKLLSVPSTAHTMTLSCPPSLVYCEDSDVLQKAYEQIANLKEDIHRLSAELEMKDLQLAGFTNHLPTLSRFILNSAEQSSKPPPNNDTELWDPSSACPRPTCSTPWTEVAVRGRKKDANSVPSPPSISTSNCYDLLYIVDFPAPPDLAAVHSIPPRPVQDAAPAVTTAAYHPCLVYPDCNTSHHYPKTELPSNYRSLETAAQRKIIALLVEIKEEQRRQWAVLRDLQARLQSQTSCEEEDVEALDMDIPLRTLEQLDDVERQLDDAGVQKRMVSYLSRMGGATIDDAVRRLMQAVLSFAVGSELNWVGRGQKRSFGKTRLQGVLFRALKRTPVGKEATHHQYADVVKKWLRFAPFRQGGTGRRCYKPPVEFPDSEEKDSFTQSCTN